MLTCHSTITTARHSSGPAKRNIQKQPASSKRRTSLDTRFTTWWARLGSGQHTVYHSRSRANMERRGLRKDIPGQW